MVVTFYKTKLNKQNRCYGAEQYDSYLSTCEKLDVTLSHDIIPNQPFNIETASGMWGYNYITYTYKGYLFGAFVDSINIQAISGTTVIYNSTDNWYFTLKNIGVNNIDFHGRVMRGHVRDTDKSHKPILDNTTLTAEEVFNNANLKFYDFTNVVKVNSDIQDYDLYKKTWYLYIYFANPKQVYPLNFPQTQFIDGDVFVGNNGLTVCYPVIQEDKYFKICQFNSDTGELTPDMDISGLTSSFITAITLSKIPPAIGIYFYKYSDTEIRLKDTYSVFHQRDWIETAKEGLPKSMLAPWAFQDVPISLSKFNDKNGTYDFVNLLNKPISRLTKYDDYLKQIPKFNSLVYMPYYIGNSVVNLLQVTDDEPFTVSLSFDLGSYIITKKVNNLGGNKSISIIQNDILFAPDTVLDYWTRLNALQTANAGKIQENAGINQGITSVGSMVKSSAGLLSSIGKLVGAAAGKDVAGIIGGVAGLVSSGTDTTVTALNLERTRENAELAAENGRMIQETANFQYDTGVTHSVQGAGYYNSYKAPSFVSIIDNSDNYKQICTNLHRYGYNTFLQLDDVYFNHVREHFNYIKCSEVEVTGVPADIADDISNMFLKGVHLWQDDVENFERTNYSKGEWNV